MNFVRKQQNSRKRYSSKFEFDKLYFEINETWDNSIAPCLKHGTILLSHVWNMGEFYCPMFRELSWLDNLNCPIFHVIWKLTWIVIFSTFHVLWLGLRKCFIFFPLKRFRWIPKRMETLYWMIKSFVKIVVVQSCKTT